MFEVPILGDLFTEPFVALLILFVAFCPMITEKEESQLFSRKHNYCAFKELENSYFHITGFL